MSHLSSSCLVHRRYFISFLPLMSGWRSPIRYLGTRLIGVKFPRKRQHSLKIRKNTWFVKIFHLRLQITNTSLKNRLPKIQHRNCLPKRLCQKKIKWLIVLNHGFFSKTEKCSIAFYFRGRKNIWKETHHFLAGWVL